jgi:hypothetical protein
MAPFGLLKVADPFDHVNPPPLKARPKNAASFDKLRMNGVEGLGPKGSLEFGGLDRPRFRRSFPPKDEGETGGP